MKSSEVFSDNLTVPCRRVTDKADIAKFNKLAFCTVHRDSYSQELPDNSDDLIKLLQIMKLATESGHLNLAGVLLFVEQPEFIVLQFVIKAICFPSSYIHETDYSDIEDFSGALSTIYKNAHAFIMRKLHKVQNGKDVNSQGTLEIPEAAFEELLVNSLTT